MALELPPELEPVLGLLGIDWPEVNEDELTRFADEVSRLASAVDSVQLAADKAVRTLRESYHGASADQLTELWTGISKFSGLVVEVCGVVANALHAGALAIEAGKAASIAQLATTQGELVAAAPSGPVGVAAVVAIGRELLADILDQAVSALGQALAKPVGDAVESVVKAVIGGGTSRSVGSGFGVDLSALASCASTLLGHADDIDVSGSSFRQVVESLDLGQPQDAFGRVVIAAGEQIGTSIGTEVIKRLLGLFQGTASGLTQVARNLTEQEAQHTQQLSGILAAHGSPMPGGPLALAGVGSALLSPPGAAGHLSLDSLSAVPGQFAAPGATGLGAPVGAVPFGVPGAVGVPGADRAADPEPGATRRSAYAAAGAASQSSVAAGSQAGYASAMGNPAGSASRQGPASTGQVRAAVRRQYLAQRAAGADPEASPEDDGDANDTNDATDDNGQ
jgi:hypothetical protein